MVSVGAIKLIAVFVLVFVFVVFKCKYENHAFDKLQCYDDTFCTMVILLSRQG